MSDAEAEEHEVSRKIASACRREKLEGNVSALRQLLTATGHLVGLAV